MAKTMKAAITPKVLKWAREKRFQLGIDYAAKKSNVKPDQLAAWEAGRDQPTFAQLKKIANTYKTHVSIFYLPEPPASFEPLADHRELPEPPMTDEKQLKELEDQAYRLNANIIEAYERRSTLIEFYELLGESPSEVTLTLSETDSPEYAAQEIRKFLQFHTGLLQQCNDDRSALKFWRQIVEEKGVLCCQTSVNTHLSIDLEIVRGFCIAQKPLPVIVVNPKDSPYGRIFTIVHELVHIALGKSVVQNTELRQVRPPDNPTEVYCNEVAAEVLVPADELSQRVNRHTFETDLPEISKHFRVSPEVIMRRLLTLDYISRQKYQAYRKKQQDKHKDSSGKPIVVPHHYKLLNTSGEHFARTAFRAYYDQKITIADLSDAFSKCDPKHLFEIENLFFA